MTSSELAHLDVRRVKRDAGSCPDTFIRKLVIAPFERISSLEEVISKDADDNVLFLPWGKEKVAMAHGNPRGEVFDAKCYGSLVSVLPENVPSYGDVPEHQRPSFEYRKERFTLMYALRAANSIFVKNDIKWGVMLVQPNHMADVCEYVEDVQHRWVQVIGVETQPKTLVQQYLDKMKADGNWKAYDFFMDSGTDHGYNGYLSVWKSFFDRLLEDVDLSSHEAVGKPLEPEPNEVFYVDFKRRELTRRV